MASAGIRVSVRRFGNLEKRLKRITNVALKREITRKMGIKTLELIKRQFVTQKDPYGNRWQKKEKPDGRPTLTGKTRDLRTNIRVSPVRLIVTFSTDYSSFHQSGTENMPQRLLFPDAGLPRAWKAAYGRIVKREIKAFLR